MWTRWDSIRHALIGTLNTSDSLEVWPGLLKGLCLPTFVECHGQVLPTDLVRIVLSEVPPCLPPLSKATELLSQELSSGTGDSCDVTTNILPVSGDGSKDRGHSFRGK